MSPTVFHIKVNVTRFGLWLAIRDNEYFLDYTNFPWFRTATIEQICDLEFLHGHHLHWPQLDIDLDECQLKNPARYPLISD